MRSRPQVCIEECAATVSGATPSTSDPSYWDGDICWATPKDLGELEGPFISDTPRKITRIGLDSCAAAVLPPQSVLFSSRAPIGHVAINTVPMATNQGFKSFIPRSDRLIAGFLYHWLRSNRAYLESLGNGATFKEVSKAVVSRLGIPLPPLPEQRRIADVLDRAEALRAKRRAALDEIEALPQAIFRGLFGEATTQGRHPWVVLAECAEVVSVVAKGRKLDGRGAVEVPYLRVANVQAGYLDLSEVKNIEALPSEVADLALKAWDVLLTEGGDFDKLGRGALFDGQVQGCIHQNHVFRVRTDASKLLPGYFHEYLQGPAARAYFLRCAKRTTNLASINMTQLRSLPVPVPPIGLQLEFSRRVAAVEKLKVAQRASLAELDALFASLQHRALRGEL
ncbi:MAG: restriction endonuclease subunit S [Verrucomicrobiae bacterium]|nr:restriction endonuclease subunit S [Verrucomicrobiae bacterium]